jgi:hypothetical protein
MTMPLRNKNAAVVIAAMLSAGALFPSIGKATPAHAVAQVQNFQSYQAGFLPSDCEGLLVASADQDDWTAWGRHEGESCP